MDSLCHRGESLKMLTPLNKVEPPHFLGKPRPQDLVTQSSLPKLVVAHPAKMGLETPLYSLSHKPQCPKGLSYGLEEGD